MSGGRFSYADCQLKSEIYGFFADEPANVFEDREISELVWDVLELIHTFDYYQCSDTSKETYLKKKDAFKKKWFGGNRGLRVKRIVDDALAETRKELYETFGLQEVSNHEQRAETEKADKP